MNGDESIIAKKYASAFLNLYLKELSVNDIENLKILEDFIEQNRFLYISLRIPSIKMETKKIAIKKIVKNFQFKKPINKLMVTLLEEGRIEILHKVLKCIRYIYAEETNIEFFTVYSSHFLNTHQKAVIAKLIQKFGKSKIRTKFVEDKCLIVGIRIESPSLLWERSIRKELMRVGKTIAIEGITC